MANSDTLDNRYLEKVKNDYNEIYGIKGIKYYNSIQKENLKAKTHKKVSFSGEILYSN